MKNLEIEQKYHLDYTRSNEIEAEIRDVTVQVEPIQQCYIYSDKPYGEGKWYRYRHTVGGGIAFVREHKQSIQMGAPYSVSIEDAVILTEPEFNEAWEKSTFKLAKSRFVLASTEIGSPLSHRVTVDFIESLHNADRVYAVVAEIEAILDPLFTYIDLDFKLPEFLKPYLLWKHDANHHRAKEFSARAVCYDSTLIAAYHSNLAKICHEELLQSPGP